MNPEFKRTHKCGELNINHVGQAIVLNGWVDVVRDHGGVIFIDLRDRYGITQIVFNPDMNKDLHAKAHEVRLEFVIAVKGRVAKRPEDSINPNLPTGEIEIMAEGLEILNVSKTPPFEINDDVDVALDQRLRYRFIDLRRPSMQRNMITRYNITRRMRQTMDELGFTEVETPILTKSTPEGARDYLVPSRVNRRCFFALPQSPQLFKQILMVAGLDKYYQIARCFRDEDLRADRQPEFTQLDIEMSFIEESDIIKVMEKVIYDVFRDVIGKEITIPFPVMPYDKAIDLYGSDAPDLRYGLEFVNISSLCSDVNFAVFKNTVEGGGIVKGFRIPGGSSLSRKELDELTEFAISHGAKGLAWFKVTSEGLSSPIAKFFPKSWQDKIIEKTGSKDGDLIMFVADKEKTVREALLQLRKHLGRKLNLIKKDALCFTWVLDFPLLEYNEEDKRYYSMHHPFTSPKLESLPILDTDPSKVKARAYDIVLNGTEIGGGSIRIHQSSLQKKIFSLLNISDEEARLRFSFLLDALEYGAPPHGGIALGLDRLVMIILGLDTIRDCIAFPKTQSAQCLMTSAPSEVDDAQLKELGIRVL